MFKISNSADLNSIVITIAIIFVALAGFIVFFILLFNKRKNKLINEKLMMKTKFDQEILQAQLEIQEQTLKTISQEIHDNIGQVLSLAKLNLNTMEIDKKEELQEKIIDSKKLVSKAIQDLRDLSRSMNTDNIEAMGLVPAISYELELIRKTGFKTTLTVEGTIVRLEPQKELILFRIIQEILNNIIKHSQAAVIDTTIHFGTNDLDILVRDNGTGFDLSPLNQSANPSFGLGIRNMRNRARLIGAHFHINSTTGEGTGVNISLPFNPQNI